MHIEPYIIKIRFSNEEFVIINVHYKCCMVLLMMIIGMRNMLLHQYLKDYIDYNLDTDSILGDYNDDI